MNTIAKAPPKLLKARMRHTRLFMIPVIALMPFMAGTIGDDSLAHWLMGVTGYILVLACVIGRAYCSLYIGGKKNEAVMEQGPYTIVRNPLYVFSFLGVVGIGLQSGMLTLAAVLVIVFGLYYPHVVKREEAFLLHKFGEPYADYTRRVPRWIPNFSLWREPDRIETHPRFVRKTFMDASLFFMPLPMFALIDLLHQWGVVPVLWNVF